MSEECAVFWSIGAIFSIYNGAVFYVGFAKDVETGIFDFGGDIVYSSNGG